MEYGLILVLIGIAAMASSESLRKRISDFFFAASDRVETAGEPEPSAEPSPTPQAGACFMRPPAGRARHSPPAARARAG